MTMMTMIALVFKILVIMMMMMMTIVVTGKKDNHKDDNTRKRQKYNDDDRKQELLTQKNCVSPWLDLKTSESSHLQSLSCDKHTVCC